MSPVPLLHPHLLLVAALAALQATPAQASLMKPVLEVMRPQLETRITQACVDALAGGAPQLAAQLRQPCRQLAAPTSRCLVRETAASGKELTVLTELLRQELGAQSERIVKRCIAQLVGLPAGSLEGLSLRQLADRFGVSSPQGTGTGRRR
ncbi:hypothetical protein [Cyanobium sp. ATX 6A2]|jgi:hypothetical protein|uniref:hypothetical protein n=1 Tax=Cyanobium sp. ATX 6A2 TaxID=2823700 RepID=UPI0020CE3C4F|nr:hypothetical protein [Cyanobium sp. ATX 6A2]